MQVRFTMSNSRIEIGQWSYSKSPLQKLMSYTQGGLIWAYQRVAKPATIWTYTTAIPWSFRQGRGLACWSYREIAKPAAIWTASIALPFAMHQSWRATCWSYRRIAKPMAIWTATTAIPWSLKHGWQATRWTYQNVAKPATVWTATTAIPWSLKKGWQATRWAYQHVVKPATIWTATTAIPWSLKKGWQAVGWTCHKAAKWAKAIGNSVTQPTKDTEADQHSLANPTQLATVVDASLPTTVDTDRSLRERQAAAPSAPPLDHRYPPPTYEQTMAADAYYLPYRHPFYGPAEAGIISAAASTSCDPSIITPKDPQNFPNLPGGCAAQCPNPLYPGRGGERLAASAG